MVSLECGAKAPDSREGLYLKFKIALGGGQYRPR
jgi:hypothetical protein